MDRESRVGTKAKLAGACLMLILVHFSTFSCILLHLGLSPLSAFKSVLSLLETDSRRYAVWDSNPGPTD